MANALFPTTIKVMMGTRLPDTYRTIRAKEDAPTLATIRKWTTPKMRGGRLVFLLTAAELKTVREFWADHHGSGTAFDFRYPWPDAFYNLLVAVANGTTTAWDLPVYNDGVQTPIDWKVYLDGVVQVSGYVFAHQAGVNGRSTVTFTPAPAAGTIITWEGSGYRQIAAVMGDGFEEKELGLDAFSVSVDLDEV